MASTLDDVMSITSSRIQPAAPHPTPAHTVAGDIPSNDFIARKLLSLELSDNSIERSDTGMYSFCSFSSPECLWRGEHRRLFKTKLIL